MDANTLRKTLAEQINLLHAKKGDPKVANAIANTAGKIISTIRLELEYCKQYGLTPSISFIKAGANGQSAKTALPSPRTAKRAR